MGKNLIIKGANFSENAISVLIKQGYGSPTAQLQSSWMYDSISANSNVIINKVEVTVPAAGSLDKTKASSLWLAAYDGVNHTNGLSKIVKIDMTDVVNDIIDNNKEISRVTLTLPTPLAINAGEYYAYAPVNTLDGESNTTNNFTICYQRNVDGTLGHSMRLYDNYQTSRGTAIDWYGVEA